jgi:diguanylate cyclase (GGDEF)-like protein
MAPIEIIRTIDINILSAIILLVILAVSVNRRERGMVQHFLFIVMVILTLFLNLLEIFAWVFDASVGAFSIDYRWLNVLFNVVIYAAVPVPVAVWLLYAHYQIFHDVNRLRRVALFTLPVVLVNALLAVLSAKNGWFFLIDAGNTYRRGPYFFLHVALTFGILGATCLLVLINRHLLEKRIFRAMLLFIVPPVAGSILQILFYGLMLNWVAVMIAVLIVYIHIQGHGLNTDYLTGTYNRRHFEQLIRSRIRRVGPEQSFAVILADMDNFKRINDLHGHKAGDEALKIAVDLIRRVLRRNDLIARFGGDEFYVLLELSSSSALKGAIKRIYHEFEQYNGSRSLPFLLELSMGGAVFDPQSGMSAEQFLRQVDQLMYQEKARRIAAPH